MAVAFVTDPNDFAIELFDSPLVQHDLPFHPGRNMHGGTRLRPGSTAKWLALDFSTASA